MFFDVWNFQKYGTSFWKITNTLSFLTISDRHAYLLKIWIVYYIFTNVRDTTTQNLEWLTQPNTSRILKKPVEFWNCIGWIGTHLNCDRFDVHEPDLGRAAVGVFDAECCCVGVKSMTADPEGKQSDSHSFDGPPAHPLPSGVIVPPRLAIPRHNSSSDKSPPGLLWPKQQKILLKSTSSSRIWVKKTLLENACGR